MWEESTTVVYTVNCRLAKFRGLMYRGKYGAVIVFKEPITWKFILGT